MQKRITAPAPHEDIEQIQLFAWAEWYSEKYPELSLMHHIPNGGRRGKAEASRLKKMGVLAGMPDIFLPCARGRFHGLYIELKRIRGGRTSDAQNTIMPALAAAGYAVAVCHGMEEAREMILKYLELKGE